MKAWQWVLLGTGAVIVIYLISRRNTTVVGYANPQANAAASLGAGLGGLIGGLFKTTGSKVQAPAGGAPPVGSSTWDPSGSAADPSKSQGLGDYTLSYEGGQASGGTTVGGGLTDAQPTNAFGIPNLSAPNFSVGTSGADFSSN